MHYRIKDLPSETRLLIACFIVALVLGYGVALLKAAQKSELSTDAVVRQYRGDKDPEAMAFPKTYEEILQNTHAHALSIPIVYFLLGALFLGTSLESGTKKFGIAALFSGYALEFTGLWGLRYVHENCVYLVFLAHAVSGPAYLYMCWRVFKESMKR